MVERHLQQIGDLVVAKHPLVGKPSHPANVRGDVEAADSADVVDLAEDLDVVGMDANLFVRLP